MHTNSDQRRGSLDRALALILLIATIGAYWQVQHHDFIYFDDPAYVTDNNYVKPGLTKHGFAWAFSTFHASNWHPLTWLSHMLDCKLYGLNPAGHHLTNLFFHVANTLLLFLVLRESTGRRWPSFLVAGLFALHPLHVESVAWVSERKDVLSTFFWFLTMLVYVRYVQQPRIHRYMLALILFAAGLLAKPMLVTLPFVLLLFDYWPLGRLGFATKTFSAHTRSAAYLLWEKAPFFLLAGASAILTFIAQSAGRAVQSLEALPLQTRILNALVSYVIYMAKTVWPHDLAIFYPHPEDTAVWWPGLASAMLLGLLCIAALREAQKRPYLVVGWLWFMGTLVPVIGLVQVGMQAMADRYTYIPLIGLFVAIVWGLCDLFARGKLYQKLLAVSGGLVLCALMLCTWLQLQNWQNTLTLFQHSLRVTKDNYAAHFILARAEGEQGEIDKAFSHYNSAVKINPSYVAMMHNRFGYDLSEQGHLEKAAIQFTGAIQIRPDYANAYNNLGVVLARKGRFKEAITHFLEALRLSPGYGKARENLENARRQKNLMEEKNQGVNKPH
jgi:tetratricopeptide (TPR) repeat protein